MNAIRAILADFDEKIEQQCLQAEFVAQVFKTIAGLKYNSGHCRLGKLDPKIPVPDFFIKTGPYQSFARM